MFPAHAPLPTDSSFPFHPGPVPDRGAPVAGIQTSILISESAVGLSVGATRQKPGRSATFGGREPGNAGMAPGGNMSCPAGTDWAKVTVECGSGSFARLSQVPAAASGEESAITRTRHRICTLYVRHRLLAACNVRYTVG